MARLMVCREAKIVLNGVLVDLLNGAGAGNRMKWKYCCFLLDLVFTKHPLIIFHFNFFDIHVLLPSPPSPRRHPSKP